MSPCTACSCNGLKLSNFVSLSFMFKRVRLKCYPHNKHQWTSAHCTMCSHVFMCLMPYDFAVHQVCFVACKELGTKCSTLFLLHRGSGSSSSAQLGDELDSCQHRTESHLLRMVQLIQPYRSWFHVWGGPISLYSVSSTCFITLQRAHPCLPNWSSLVLNVAQMLCTQFWTALDCSRTRTWLLAASMAVSVSAKAHQNYVVPSINSFWVTGTSTLHKQSGTEGNTWSPQLMCILSLVYQTSAWDPVPGCMLGCWMNLSGITWFVSKSVVTLHKLLLTPLSSMCGVFAQACEVSCFIRIVILVTCEALN